MFALSYLTISMLLKLYFMNHANSKLSKVIYLMAQNIYLRLLFKGIGTKNLRNLLILNALAIEF